MHEVVLLSNDTSEPDIFDRGRIVASISVYSCNMYMTRSPQDPGRATYCAGPIYLPILKLLSLCVRDGLHMHSHRGQTQVSMGFGHVHTLG
jgi:hypothetical protein